MSYAVSIPIANGLHLATPCSNISYIGTVDNRAVPGKIITAMVLRLDHGYHENTELSPCCKPQNETYEKEKCL